MNSVFYRQQLTSFVTGQASQGPLWWLWMLVLPVVPLIAYMFLGYVKILPDTEGIPRPVYIVIGMTCWLMFYDTVSSPFRAVDKNKQYFIRREISLGALFSSWLPERLIGSAIQLIFCVVLVATLVGTDSLSAFMFLLAYLLGALTLLSFGFLLAVIGMLSPSTMNLADIANRFLLFLSGAIFPLPDSGVASVIQYANPYYVFIENSRRLLLGLEPDWQQLLSWILVGLSIWIFVAIQLPKIDSDVRDFLQ